jgi:hypothetical protein
MSRPRAEPPVPDPAAPRSLAEIIADPLAAYLAAAARWDGGKPFSRMLRWHRETGELPRNPWLAKAVLLDAELDAALKRDDAGRRAAAGAGGSGDDGGR